MVEVEFLKNGDGTDRNFRTCGSSYTSGEKAGFDEETAHMLVAKGAAKILRESVPDTAGISGGASRLEQDARKRFKN